MSGSEQAEERPRPKVRDRCWKCPVTQADVDANRVVVSPFGTAHLGEPWGVTVCGLRDGDGWWWPL